MNSRLTDIETHTGSSQLTDSVSAILGIAK
jgi:hypothetical protein